MSFLWGAATSAHQVEGGGSRSDVWRVENQDGGPFVEPSGQACGSWERYPEDVALVADMGLDAYRFSIEWARIEPSPGVLDLDAVEHYRAVVDCCRDAGLEPVVTLHHFTSPDWLSRRGGWFEPEAVERFTRYVQSVQPVLQDVEVVCTVNEPNVLADSAHLLTVPERGVAAGVARARLLEAHHRSLPLLAGRQAGLTVAMSGWRAADGAQDRLGALRAEAEDACLVGLEGDFVGVQTYTELHVDEQGLVEPGPDEPTTLTGWRVRPRTLAETVRRAAVLTGLPVIVTENGIATADDGQREQYLVAALEEVDALLADGLDLRGYFHWSLLDNFEWLHGYRPTFGLVAVDRTTLDRTPKPSSRRYADEVRRRRTSGS